MNCDAFFNGFWFYSILAGWSTWQWVFFNSSINWWSFDTPDTTGCASAVVWNRFETFLLKWNGCLIRVSGVNKCYFQIKKTLLNQGIYAISCRKKSMLNWESCWLKPCYQGTHCCSSIDFEIIPLKISVWANSAAIAHALKQRFCCTLRRAFHINTYNSPAMFCLLVQTEEKGN